jgi:outer membrane protein assembly factor BamD (BamD/ComL family)
MSTPDDLTKQREALQNKLKQTEEMIGKGLSWKDAQFYLQKYKEELRQLDSKIARLQLGEDAVSALRTRKQELLAKLQALEAMKKSNEISNKIYKEKKKDIEKEIQQVERDIVEKI